MMRNDWNLKTNLPNNIWKSSLTKSILAVLAIWVTASSIQADDVKTVLDWASINNLKHQCDVLKPGTEQVIQLTKRELDEQFTRVIESAGCKAVITREDGKTVVKVSKPKQENNNDLLAGLSLGDLKKEANKDIATKEQLVASLSYWEDFSKNILNLFKWVTSNNIDKESVKHYLDNMLTDAKWLKSKNFLWQKEKWNNWWIDWLKTLKIRYANDKTILNLIDHIINNLNDFYSKHRSY